MSENSQSEHVNNHYFPLAIVFNENTVYAVFVLIFFTYWSEYQIQCGKPCFSNTHQNGEWTETSTRQNEIELAMFGEWYFFKTRQQIPNKQYSNVQQFILQILTKSLTWSRRINTLLRAALISSSPISLSSSFKF